MHFNLKPVTTFRREEIIKCINVLYSLKSNNQFLIDHIPSTSYEGSETLLDQDAFVIPSFRSILTGKKIKQSARN